MRGALHFFLIIALLILSGCGNAPAVQKMTTTANTPKTTTTAKVQQVVSDDVMPSDILEALNAKDSGVENSANKNILLTVELPTSLSISIPNIDLTKVHQTQPLQQPQIDSLKSRDFSDEMIATMDYGDYANVEKTWLLTSDMIKNAKNIYPDLANMDISNWTYGDFLTYSVKADSKTYAPTEDQAKALKERNITLEDARKLLKVFNSYDTILKQNDKTLKGYIEKDYQSTIEYIKGLKL